MFQQFIDRQEEVNVLEERFKVSKPEFVVVYGRRRVGKTELATHFLRDKPSIYFLAEEKKYEDNLSEMKDIMGDFLKDDEFKMIKFENWVQLFKSFSEKIKGRTAIVIDEFPYLVKGNNAVPSEFQKIWDVQISKSKNIMLVLVGSSVSMMEKLLGQKSPLFGRRTAQLEIKPVDIFHVKDFLPTYGIEDCIRVYGCADGIPLYLKQFDMRQDVFENMKNIFFRRDALLYNEAEILMKQEFREPANYFAILKAISFGNARQNEIVNYTNIDKSIISKYLKNLEDIRIIRKEYPVTERKEARKSARYTFSDNYFRFWFRFVYPHKTSVEKGSLDAFNIMMQSYDAYLGIVFERVSSDFLWKNRPFNFTKLGRWWHKDKEIDIVALDEISKNIFFFECKWQNLKEGAAIRIMEQLKAKAQSVNWHNNKRQESFGLIAKHIEGRKKLKKQGYLVFDFESFEEQ